MINNDKKIRKGLGPRRAIESYQLQHDIVIPAGTILRDNGEDAFGAEIGTACVGFHAEIVLKVDAGAVASGLFKRVVA